MPDTDETDYGLWPTPRSGKTTDENLESWQATPPLTLAVKMWPTPTKQDGENNGGPSQYHRNSLPLNTLVKMYPTPMVGSTSPAAHNAISGQWKTAMAKVTGEPVTGCLNPEWVEALMGYPPGWTEIA
jgi:hypothetical protein